MKSIKKTVALILALCMSAAFVCSCNENSKSEETSDETSARTSAETEAGEATEASEPTESTESDPTPTDMSSEEMAYHAYMSYIDELEAQRPGQLRYHFDETYGEYKESDYSLFVTEPGSSTMTCYTLINGVVTEADNYPAGHTCFTYEDIKKFPVLATSPWAYTSYEIPVLENVPDGTYFGGIFAFALDGSMALVSIGEPVLIRTSDYNNLQPGDHISIADNDPNFTALYDLTVSDSYDGENNMFESECWFQQYTDEYYILVTDSDSVVTYNYSMALVNIAPNCVINDKYQILYGISDGTNCTGFPYSGGANNLTNTLFYHIYTGDTPEDMLSVGELYNGWTTANGICEPIVIENGTVSYISIGWR